MRPRQGHEQPGLEAVLVRRLDLLPGEFSRRVAVDGQRIVGKAGEVHGSLRNLRRIGIRPPPATRVRRLRGERKTRPQRSVTSARLRQRKGWAPLEMRGEA